MAQHHQRSERGQGPGGLLRNWLRNALLFGSEGVAEDIGSACPISPIEIENDTSVHSACDVPSSAHCASGVEDCLSIPLDEGVSEPSAVLLPFPIRGEALLVRLAELLRHRVGNDGPRHDPFLFALSRRPQSRLTLDVQSYVEFVSSREEFRLAIDVAPNTSITITTADFDTLVEFVVQYVCSRLAEAPALEAVS
ncbi:MAG TPA: hypothetical protein VHU22_25210 [Xanthobacteraceae bacterium]|jgi:hypothetical protein|nr:hypothetical protein [Xanthobacteraceae bacterium]